MLNTGTRLGPYEIQSALGAGGMGAVYKARDTRLERTVAVKVLTGGPISSTELRQRFEREARAISALQHPNICVLHDIGNQDGLDYLVMEYVEGETLSQRLRRGALPIRRIARVADVPVDTPVAFTYPDPHDDCLLLRTAPDRWLAFSQKCTHLGCAVIPQIASGKFHCPCHEGWFDLNTGAVLAGPPRRPLPRVRLEIRDGYLYATGMELRG